MESKIKELQNKLSKLTLDDIVIENNLIQIKDTNFYLTTKVISDKEQTALIYNNIDPKTLEEEYITLCLLDCNIYYNLIDLQNKILIDKLLAHL